MWVALPHLLFESPRHVLGPEPAALFRNDDLEREVEEEITKFSLDMGNVTRADGLIELEGFFDEIGPEGFRCLRHVPRTTGPQVAYQGEGPAQRVITMHRRGSGGVRVRER